MNTNISHLSPLGLTRVTDTTPKAIFDCVWKVASLKLHGKKRHEGLSTILHSVHHEKDDKFYNKNAILAYNIVV